MQGPRFGPSTGSVRSLELERPKSRGLVSPPSLKHHDSDLDAWPPPVAASGSGSGSENLLRRRQEMELERDMDPGGPPSSRWKTLRKVARRHLKFLGPGIVAAIAYIDPGNFATALSAGAGYGYSHLFVVLLSGLFAILLQILACRLGCVSGKDLAQHYRIMLHDRPTHTMLWRWGVLYPLYAIAEAGIIFTDLAELLGSAIALNLLIPRLPLWGGVLLTSADIFLVLLLFNSYGNEVTTSAMRLFEGLLALLVLTVLVAFIVLLARLSPNWGDVFHGYIPSSGIISHGGLYNAVGIIGATVMPHALFLGSRIATMDRISPPTRREESCPYASDVELADSPDRPQRPRRRSSLQPSLVRSLTLQSQTKPEDVRANAEPVKVLRTVKFCRQHISHSSADIAFSLVTFAITINSAILILAGAAFFYGGNAGADVGSLQSAYALLQARVGTATAYLFAIALLASGQAASITVTLAGQCVSEGFLNWKTSPFLRRLITRLIGIVPSLAVAVAVGKNGVDTLLVASQVALSIVLPFVIGPLLIFTTSTAIMSVDGTDPTATPRSPALPTSNPPGVSSETRVDALKVIARKINPFRRRTPPPEGKVSFANPVWVAWLGWAIWTLVVIANVYAIVQLASGAA